MESASLLIVDDSKMSRMLLRKLVGALRPDWPIREAASGAEALEMIAQSTPTMVSLDVNMPGMSGLEVAGHIRAHHPEIRVVLCTANIQDAVRQAAERAGVHFIPKPITEDSITRMIQLFEE